MRIAGTTHWAFEGLGEPLTLYRVVSGTLSANTEKMFEFWSKMMEGVRTYAPDLAARYGNKAHAYQVRYYARRAVQERQPGKAVSQLWQALRLHPRMMLEEPRRTTMTIAAVALAAILPGGVFARIQDWVIKRAPKLASSR
jgi:hypothetical protein